MIAETEKGSGLVEDTFMKILKVQLVEHRKGGLSGSLGGFCRERLSIEAYCRRMSVYRTSAAEK